MSKVTPVAFMSSRQCRSRSASFLSDVSRGMESLKAAMRAEIFLYTCIFCRVFGSIFLRVLVKPAMPRFSVPTSSSAQSIADHFLMLSLMEE